MQYASYLELEKWIGNKTKLHMYWIMLVGIFQSNKIQ